MTDPNAPQNVPSEQPTSVTAVRSAGIRRRRPAAAASSSRATARCTRTPCAAVGPDGQQTPAPQQAWAVGPAADRRAGWPVGSAAAGPVRPAATPVGRDAAHRPVRTGDRPVRSGRRPVRSPRPVSTASRSTPASTARPRRPTAVAEASTVSRSSSTRRLSRRRRTPGRARPVSRSSRWASRAASLRPSPWWASSGRFFSISEYFPVGDVLLSFGANLVNIALWGAGAALILIIVRPLTRVRTARDLCSRSVSPPRSAPVSCCSSC